MLLAVLTLNPATAQDSPQKFTLQQCLDFAVNNSYAMQKAALDVKEAACKTGEVKAGLFPQVSGIPIGGIYRDRLFERFIEKKMING
jgi:outer membrane protein TolC